MGLNKPFDRPLFVIGGAVKKTGGISGLTKGQLMVADTSKTTAEGAGVATNLGTKNKKKKDLKILVGIEPRVQTRSQTYEHEATLPFAIENIVDLTVSVPERTTPQVDELIIGYDGIDPDTSLSFKQGGRPFNIWLRLHGGIVPYLGSGNQEEIVQLSQEISTVNPYNSCDDVEDCEPINCKEITREMVERLKSHQLGGGKPLEEVLEITAITSCNENTPTVDYTYWTVSVCDTGDANALALLQAQYDFPVKRIGRAGSVSTYQALLISTDTPDDYEQTLPTLMANCSTCPAGYDLVEGGLLYSFTAEDDGTLINYVIPNAVGGTLVKHGNDGGVGIYTVVLTAKLTDANLATISTAYPTLRITYVNTVADACENDTITETEWVEGDTCGASTETYKITLPDTECGETRLAELQAAYPDNTVTIAQENSVNSRNTITLTGTSGTANINVGGTNYLATFATNLTTTANNFVTAHAAAILSASGVVVTANSGVLTFVGLTSIIDGLSITNATTNLTGTTGLAVIIQQNVSGGCQTQYQIVVNTNMVCEECDPIFEDYYRSPRPEGFAGNQWSLVVTGGDAEGDCLCGIRIRSKLYKLTPDECLIGNYPFVEDSILIDASAGYNDSIYLSAGRDATEPAKVTFLTRYAPRTHLAGNLLFKEREGHAYFRGLGWSKDLIARRLLGTNSYFNDLDSQYVQYNLLVNHDRFAQSFGNRSDKYVVYNFFVEFGRHQAVEDALNELAVANGLGTVQALGA